MAIDYAMFMLRRRDRSDGWTQRRATKGVDDGIGHMESIQN